MRTQSRILAIVATSVLAACSATTNLSSTQPGAKVFIHTSEQSEAPRSETFSTTSFGNYEFKVEAEGHAPMYGVLPLKFNSGYLALDILFFAPATFFNLREVFPYYDFDIEKGVVKYKLKPEDNWTSYVPLTEEAARAEAKLSTKQQLSKSIQQ